MRNDLSEQTLYPLVFEPIFVERIWGGTRLERLLKKNLPKGARIGESWEVVDLPDYQSVVANGPLVGMTLHHLVENYERELLGPVARDRGRFPLLVKYIDAEETLSLQVHPDEVVAQNWNGRAKDEAWYILAAKSDARLYLGLEPGSREEDIRRALSSGTLQDLLITHRVSPGDLYRIRPGTVHAIGAGIFLAEVQQPSDTTYRLYDWGRVGLDGKPRDLHLDASLASIDYASRPQMAGTKVDGPNFRIEIRDCAAQNDLSANRIGPLILVTLVGHARLCGPGDIDDRLQPGRVVLVPHCCRTQTSIVGASEDFKVMQVTFPC